MNSVKEAPSYISMDWDSVGIPMNNFINNVSNPNQIPSSQNFPAPVSTKKSIHSLERKHYIYILIFILLFVILVYFCSKKGVEEEPIKIDIKQKKIKKKNDHDFFLVQTKLDTQDTHEEKKEKMNEHIEKLSEKMTDKISEKNPEKKLEVPASKSKKHRIRPAIGDDFFHLDEQDSDDSQENNYGSQFQYKQAPFSAPPMQPAVFL